VRGISSFTSGSVLFLLPFLPSFLKERSKLMAGSLKDLSVQTGRFVGSGAWLADCVEVSAVI
jgi:hypothetical protein